MRKVSRIGSGPEDIFWAEEYQACWPLHTKEGAGRHANGAGILHFFSQMVHGRLSQGGHLILPPCLISEFRASQYCLSPLNHIMSAHAVKTSPRQLVIDPRAH
jgi:hypothetical protein